MRLGMPVGVNGVPAHNCGRKSDDIYLVYSDTGPQPLEKRDTHLFKTQPKQLGCLRLSLLPNLRHLVNSLRKGN